MPTLIQTSRSKTAAADALVGLWTVALTAFLIATLYFARPILIPLALAALFTFLLSPLVTRIERWIGRIAAVLAVVTMIFTVTSVTGWVLTRQFVDLATKLPDYKVNIQTKLRSFKVPTGGAVSRLSQTVEELKKDLPGTASPAVVPTPGTPESTTIPANAAQGAPAQAVETSKASPMELAQSAIAPLLGPLGTGALVSLLVTCMLLQREDLRSRLIRLIGQGRIGATTRAMVRARVSRVTCSCSSWSMSPTASPSRPGSTSLACQMPCCGASSRR